MEPRPRLRFAVFGLAASAFWLSFFHRVAPAALASDLTRAFQLSSVALGMLAATYFYIYTVMQLPTGILVDTLGPRRILALGGLVSGAGSLMLGLAGSFGMAALGRSLVGLGVSVVFVSMLKLYSVWFDERRFATVVGMSNVVGTSGAFVAGAPLAFLVTRVSWRHVFVAAGMASVLVSLAIWTWVRDRPAPLAGGNMPKSTTPWLEGLGAVVRNRATWPGFWINVGMMGTYLAFVGLWAVPYLVDVHGMTRLEATRHTSVMVVASALSGSVLTALSDHIERRRPILMGAAAIYLACWVALLSGNASSRTATYALCAAMGASSAGFFLSWACAKEVNPPAFAGIAVSVVNTGGFLAVALLQPAVGLLLDRAGGTAAAYGPGILVLTGFAAIGLAATLFVRETGCRNLWEAT